MVFTGIIDISEIHHKRAKESFGDKIKSVPDGFLRSHHNYHLRKEIRNFRFIHPEHRRFAFLHVYEYKLFSYFWVYQHFQPGEASFYQGKAQQYVCHQLVLCWPFSCLSASLNNSSCHFDFDLLLCNQFTKYWDELLFNFGLLLACKLDVFSLWVVDLNSFF